MKRIISPAYRGLALLAIAAVATACASPTDMGVMEKPSSASIASDSVCPDSVLAIAYADTVNFVAPDANYDGPFHVTNAGSASCYTTATATVATGTEPDYLRSPYQSTTGYFLLLPEGATVTGYYVAGHNLGFGWVGMSLGDGIVKTQAKLHVTSP